MSLYTWTCIIGVILAGISLGNYLGGRLADQWASPRLLGWIFVLGGLAFLVHLHITDIDFEIQSPIVKVEASDRRLSSWRRIET